MVPLTWPASAGHPLPLGEGFARNTMASPLVEILRKRIRDHGLLSFRDFMDAALYHPEFGYYASPRNPLGRDGDFYTSADLDPVFGKLLARRFTAMAAELNVPVESFAVVELGAGRGILARDILRSQKFPYRILERSAAMRERQRALLQAFDVEWIEDFPKDIVGCVFSNEFFDALPVHRVVRRNGALREIYLDENFAEVEGDPQHAIDVPVEEGNLADVNLDAMEWVGREASVR